MCEPLMAVREEMSEVYVHQDAQETTTKGPYLPTRNADRSAHKCAASDNTARDPDSNPPITSTTKNEKHRTDAVFSFRRTSLRRSLSAWTS